ncbi:hypothetical protein GUITHDRAFT_152572 [Guillardia theta CCMP2712]|uniref:Uncharacterized protein n=1 Tax=Guillardia theta (strain CCMP2712) TaxID=905079 RepID=L1JC00_GUITC|nr:hypothetical protein GUITHDRAFT_152572 [Guillardia theta CCMP2712]EKX45807.1 hypothetical protein GUITHDRAFT_152572 [Guillardia theta CCMP2712]|eukprot:XP_005832787.1 hypothetical protein GUITHDRAFT_152572 [Guillardia theta CCMP2712]
MSMPKILPAAARALTRSGANTTAQKRFMSATAAESSSMKDYFFSTWVKPDVYPIVFICGLATTFCGITISKRFGMHENVTWSKKARNQGVAQQYAHKYPGTESAVVAGIQK